MLINFTALSNYIIKRPNYNNRNITNWFNKTWINSSNNNLKEEEIKKTTNFLPGLKNGRNNRFKLSLRPTLTSIIPTTKPLILNNRIRRRETPLILAPKTLNLLRNILIKYLELNQPRKALHYFKLFISQPVTELDKNYTESELFRVLQLFLEFNKIEETFELIKFLKDKNLNLNIPKSLYNKLLYSSINSILNLKDSNKKLNLILNWLNQNKKINGEEINFQDLEGEENFNFIDPLLISSILEILKRLNKSDLSLEIFNSYLETLPENVIGSTEIWSKMIRIIGLQENLQEAENIFIRWRNRYQTINQDNLDKEDYHPDEGPYLAMLDVFSHHSITSNFKGRRRNIDPSTKFLPLLSSDKLKLSTSIFNSLLRLELSRKSYTSLWGLWNKMIEGNWLKNEITWKLSLKAKILQQGLLGRRKGMYDNQYGTTEGRSTGLQFLAGYESSDGPTARELFKLFLKENQLKLGIGIGIGIGGNRKRLPSIKLPNYLNPIMTTNLLNSFLKLFINLGDWKSSLIVLETFKVYKIEPDEKTHGIVVIGVVQSWEKGLLEDTTRTSNSYNNLGVRGEEFDRINGFREEEEGSRERVIRRQSDALNMISEILQERKMRIALWTGKQQVKEFKLHQSSSQSQSPTDDSEEEEEGIKEFKEFNPPPTPEWMLKRECRDIEYLGTLLQRCGKLDSVRWGEALSDLRKELLPTRNIVQEE